MHRQDTVTYMFIYAMLNAVHTMQITHLNITERSLIQAVKVGRGISCQSILFQRGQCLSIFDSIRQYTYSERTQHYYVQMYWYFEKQSGRLYACIHLYVCHLYAHLSSLDTTCKELSLQYYNRFHVSSSWQRNLKLTCQFTPGSVFGSMLDSSHNMQRSLNSILQQAP